MIMFGHENKLYYAESQGSFLQYPILFHQMWVQVIHLSSDKHFHFRKIVYFRNNIWNTEHQYIADNSFMAF